MSSSRTVTVFNFQLNRKGGSKFYSSDRHFFLHKMTEGTQNNPMCIGSNANLLKEMSKDQLIEMVMGLNSKISQLHEDFRTVTNLRLYHLEWKLNMNSQYSRRDSLETTGISKNIQDEQLEDEVLEIFRGKSYPKPPTNKKA